MIFIALAAVVQNEDNKNDRMLFMLWHTKSIPLVILTAGCSFISPAMALDFTTGGFFESSHLDLTLQNVWMLNTTDQLADQGVGDQNAWAQAVHLNWQSGWVWDAIGVDASWYGVEKLYANDAFYGRDLVRDNNGHAEGFNKLGQIYAKGRWGDKTRHLYSWAGWKEMYKFGTLTSSRSRATPSTWEGLSSEAVWDELTLRGAIVTRFSERDEPEKRRFITLASNQQIDYIGTGDVSWSPNKGTKISYIVGEAKDYLMRQGLEANATWPITKNFNLLTRGVFYYNRGLSEWEETRAFNHDAKHYYAQIGYQYGASESGIGWSKTEAPLDDGLGYFYWHFGKNTRGAFNSPADGEGNDYINDGEQMVYLYSKYKFSEEFVAGLYGNYGYGMEYQGVSLKEWEYGGYFLWSPNFIKGFTVFAGVGPSYSWKLTSKKTPSLTDDKGTFNRAKGIGAAVRVEYQINLF